MRAVTASMRFGLSVLYYLRLILGKKIFGTIARSLRFISGGVIPLWNEHFPKNASKISNKSIFTQNKKASKSNLKVVYFPSCITRSMGISKGYKSAMDLAKVTKVLLNRAVTKSSTLKILILFAVEWHSQAKDLLKQAKKLQTGSKRLSQRLRMEEKFQFV
jgi:hypothetical protein